MIGSGKNNLTDIKDFVPSPLFLKTVLEIFKAQPNSIQNLS